MTHLEEHRQNLRMECAAVSRGYDIRAVANIVLDEAEKAGRALTNLHLNKILYFIHVEYLGRYDVPLTNAKIEAWEFGPVFREVYNQFKKCGRQPITGRAMKVDFDSGEKVVAAEAFASGERTVIADLANFYSGMPAGLLVDLSHAKGGAWDRVWFHEGDLNVGMEITNDAIRKYEVNMGRAVRRLQ